MVRPMLGRPIDKTTLMRLVEDDQWATQQKCVTGDTPVWTSRGFVRADSVKAGDRVMGSDGGWHPVERVVRTEASLDPAVEVRTAMLPFRSTEDHLVLTSEGWKKAGELKMGDSLVVPKPLLSSGELGPIRLTMHASYVKEIPWTTDFAWLVGYWIGDGCADNGMNNKTRGRISFAVNLRDQVLATRIERLLTGIGITPRRHCPEDRNLIHIWGVDVPLAEWLNEHFRTHSEDGHVREGARSKTLPEWVDWFSDDLAESLLQGWRKADGHKRSSDGAVTAATVSPSLSAAVVRQCLARGVPVSIGQYVSSWEYKGVKKKGSYYQLGFLQRQRHLLWDGSRWLATVFSVEPLKAERRVVFDFTVPETHDFVAGVVLHNCDGRRLVTSVDDGQVRAWGRDGQDVAVHGAISAALVRTFPNGSFMLDGELVRLNSHHQRYIVFDLIQAGELVTSSSSFAERYTALEHLTRIAGWECVEALTCLPMASRHVEKVQMVRKLISAGAEGVICRRLGSSYHPGRTNDLLKFKLTNTVDCVVKALSVGGRKNMVLEVYDDDGNPVEIGHCTAANGDGPGVRVGSVVSVSYLRFTKDGRLREPTKPILRLDKKPRECTLDQLVYSDMKDLV